MTQSTKSTPTLDDVAKRAGVSTATVSRCLNTPDRVVEATRTRVQDAINALGYTPNFGARAMAARRTFTIGAVIPTMENAIFARGLQAFQEELDLQGYMLLVASSWYRPEVEEQQIRSLVARGADALLLIGYDRDPAIYAYLEQQGVPFLISWAYVPEASHASIGFDNHQSMRALAEKVASLGHTRIGVISGVTKGNDRAQERLRAIHDVFEPLGCTPVVVEATYDFNEGANAFDTLMARDPRPSVVMCGNDVLAVGAVRRARKLGLKVPGDVSITGFDDIEIAKIVSPALTTVHVPHRKMGRKAAKALVRMVEDKGAVASVQLQSKLKIRSSLGPA